MLLPLTDSHARGTVQSGQVKVGSVQFSPATAGVRSDVPDSLGLQSLGLAAVAVRRSGCSAGCRATTQAMGRKRQGRAGSAGQDRTGWDRMGWDGTYGMGR